MASPDRMRNSQLLRLISEMPDWAFVRNTIPHAMINTTKVRIAVARLEFTPSIPVLASMEVNAANMEDKRANNSHMSVTSNLFFPIFSEPEDCLFSATLLRFHKIHLNQ